MLGSLTSVLAAYCMVIQIPMLYSFCPPTRLMWIKRGKDLGCDGKSGKTYHCFIDDDGNNTETCMTARLIEPHQIGCPRFGLYRGRIRLLNPFKPCTENITDCPGENHRYYYTDELYKYPSCILITKTEEKIESSTGSLNGNNRTNSSTLYDKPGIISAIDQDTLELKKQHGQLSRKLEEEAHENKSFVIGNIICTCIAWILCIVIILYIRRKIKVGYNDSYKKSETQESMLLLENDGDRSEREKLSPVPETSLKMIEIETDDNGAGTSISANEQDVLPELGCMDIRVDALIPEETTALK